jgi:hypothetical protein
LESLGAEIPGPDFCLALSAGLAGALDPGLSTGDIVVDLGPEDRALEAAAREAAGRRGLRLRLDRIADADCVLGPEAKASLRSATGAAAVDMEGRALRCWAQGRGLASVNARVILDEAAGAVPACFPDPDDAWALARGILSRPTLLPSLLVAGWRARRCLAGLAVFLEEFLPLP